MIKEENNKIWKFIGFLTDSDKLLIDNLNIWDFKWINTGEFITVSHPTYKNQTYHEEVKLIDSNGHKIYFIAFELSANSWGIYLKDEYNLKFIR